MAVKKAKPAPKKPLVKKAKPNKPAKKAEKKPRQKAQPKAEQKKAAKEAPQEPAPAAQPQRNVAALESRILLWARTLHRDEPAATRDVPRHPCRKIRIPHRLLHRTRTGRESIPRQANLVENLDLRRHHHSGALPALRQGWFLD